MGIEGLHPLLKSAIQRVDIRTTRFQHTTCAVDTSFLLHRGAYACAGKLAQKESTDRYVVYVTRFVERLLEWQIKPIMVFDGSPLPAKRITNMNRSDERERNRLRGQKALASGKTREAEQFFQKAIEITPEMVLTVIRALRTMGVDVIVAPYEADAQLAYLNISKIADYVITEDSDLVLFGCHHILFKLDETGQGELFERSKLDLKKEFGLDSFERFRWMCILSGCDYLENIAGIGLAKAKKIMSKTQVTNIELILKQLPQNLGKLNLRVTDDYIQGFKRAHLAFLHQIVYDPLQRKQVPLNPYSDDIDQELIKFAGQRDDSPRAFQHAIGNLNVKTKCSVDNFDPSNWKYRPPCSTAIPTPHLQSIWSKDYAIRVEPFLFSSTPVNREPLPSPSPPRKIRHSSSTPTTMSNTNVLSSTAILDMYRPSSSSSQVTVKETSSVEYHTSVIQSIEIVKRHCVFEQYDNDKSSRFFSSSSVSQTSVFDAIDKQQSQSILSDQKNTSPSSSSGSSHKRFKRLNTDEDTESSQSSSVFSSQSKSQSTADPLTTPTKQTRAVLMKKSSNITKEISEVEDTDPKSLDDRTEDQSKSELPAVLESTMKASSPILQLPQSLRDRFSKPGTSRMIRPT